MMVLTFTQLQGVPKRLMHYIVTAANKKVSGDAGKAAAPKASPVRPTASVSDVPVAKTTTTTTKSRTIKAPPAESPLVTSALQIVSEEMGMELSALTDDVCFTEAGLDSLLSLVISSRMRDQLEIDFESAQFMEIGSIGALKKFLRELVGVPAANEDTVVEVEETVVQEELVAPVAEVVTDDPWPKILDILSEESGIVTQDLTDDVQFADAGVDSLLSLVITSRLRDELELDLPDRALFQDCTTVGGLRKHFGSGGPATPTSSSGSESEISRSIVAPTPATEPPTPWWSDTEASLLDTPPSELEEIVEEEMVETKAHSVAKARIPPAWSMYLQGSPKRSTETLFLFPDGCGAATSYLNLPRVGATTAIVGFNSPFMK